VSAFRVRGECIEGRGWGVVSLLLLLLLYAGGRFLEDVWLMFVVGIRIQAIDSREKKIRRLGGREQITSDGRHLIDGVPFGRPFLRNPVDRPAVRIPPKRGRERRLEIEWNQQKPEITTEVYKDVLGEEGSLDDEDDGDYVEGEDGESEDEDEDMEDEDKENVPSRAVMLRTDFDDADVDEEEEYMGLEDQEQVVEEDEWHGFDSSQDAQAGAGAVEDLPMPDIADMGDGRRRSRRLRISQGDASGEGLTWIRPDDEMTVNAITKKRCTGTREEQNGNQDVVERPVQVLEDSRINDNSYTDGSESSESTTRLVTQSDENLLQLGRAMDDETSSSGTSSSESTSDSDSDSDLSSDSDSESESDSSSDESSLSESSSSSSSDEEEESDVEERPTMNRHASSLASPNKNKVEGQQVKPTAPTQPETRIPLLKEPSESKLEAPQKVNPPGQGSSATKTRNKRNKLRKLKKAGKLPPSATLQDLDAYVTDLQSNSRAANAVDNMEDQDGQGQASGEKDTDIDDPARESEQAAFEAKRQKLLDAIASGGIDVKMLDDRTNEPSDMRQVVSTPALVEPITDLVEGEAVSGPARKRSRLDISSTRRLLFGSLGVRAPKTKEDEEATRRKLAGHSQTSSRGQYAAMDDLHDSTIIGEKKLINQVLVPDSQEDDETWKKKIILKAVECCYDGVELSTPPFPFVQRWDPQQQTRGQKRKRGNGGHAVSRQAEQQTYRHVEEEWNVQLNYDDDKEPQLPEISHSTKKGDNGAIRDQLMREANDLSATSPSSEPIVDDMPPLPADLTKYPTLEKRNATFGSIIIYKVLQMSKETNWSPVNSEYRTAHIDRVDADGTLKLTLAKRDWDRKEIIIDENTGERIYDKFDMPDADEDEEEDDGKRYLTIDELIEPKLVKAGEPYYLPEPLAEEEIGENDQMEDSVLVNEEAGDVTTMPEPSLELHVVRRTSFSVEQDPEERPSSGEVADGGEPTKGPERPMVDNPSPDLGATQAPITQRDGSVEDAVVQETPAVSFQENPETNTQASSSKSLSSPARAEVSRLIKDAGFRQSIDSQVAWPRPEESSSNPMTSESREDGGSQESANNAREQVGTEKTPTHQATMNRDAAGSENHVSSPRFNGFSSSPGLSTFDQHDDSQNKTAFNGSDFREVTPKAKNTFKSFDTPCFSGLPEESNATNVEIPEEEGGDFTGDFDDTPAFRDDTDMVEDSFVVSGNMQDGQQVNAPPNEISQDDSLLKPISLSKENSLSSHNSHGVDGAADADELPQPDQIFSSTAPARSSGLSPPATKRNGKRSSKGSKSRDRVVRRCASGSPVRRRNLCKVFQT
jgi:hypothetical protein